MVLNLKDTKTPEPIKRGPGRPPSAATAKKREAAAADRIARRADGANALLQMVAGGLMLARQTADAAVISERGPRIAEAAAKTAEENANIAKVLDGMSQAGPYGELLIEIIPVAVLILVNHDRLPPSFAALVGGDDPETARVKAETAAMEALAAEHEKAADVERRREAAKVNLEKQEREMRNDAA